MKGFKKRFEDKPCLAIGRGLKVPIQPHILHDPKEISDFRDWAIFEFELPWFTVIVIDNF